MAELEAELNDTIEELHQIKNQSVVAHNQAQQYKRNFEELDGKKQLEIDKLIQEMSYLQNDKKELKKLLEGKDKNFECTRIFLFNGLEYLNENKKVRRELEEMKLELEDVNRALTLTKSDLANEKEISSTAMKHERELRTKTQELTDLVNKLQKDIQAT